METENLVTNQEAQTEAAPAAQLEQKEAVYQFIVEALAGATPAEGQALKSLVTKEVRKAVRVKLFDGIKAGLIKYKPSGKTDGQLKKYCSSLINNWLKKDERLN